MHSQSAMHRLPLSRLRPFPPPPNPCPKRYLQAAAAHTLQPAVGGQGSPLLGTWEGASWGSPPGYAAAAAAAAAAAGGGTAGVNSGGGSGGSGGAGGVRVDGFGGAAGEGQRAQWSRGQYETGYTQWRAQQQQQQHYEEGLGQGFGQGLHPEEAAMVGGTMHPQWQYGHEAPPAFASGSGRREAEGARRAGGGSGSGTDGSMSRWRQYSEDQYRAGGVGEAGPGSYPYMEPLGPAGMASWGRHMMMGKSATKGAVRFGACCRLKEACTLAAKVLHGRAEGLGRP